MRKFYIEKEITEIPKILKEREKKSLKEISSVLKEPILMIGVQSSIDLPGGIGEKIADKLGIDLKVRNANEASDVFANTVIGISRSGESGETVSAFKQSKAKIKIAISSKKNSSLVKSANYFIPMICTEEKTTFATKSIIEQAYIVGRLLLENKNKYQPLSKKDIKQIEYNLKLKFPKQVLDDFINAERVIVSGEESLAIEVANKFEEVCKTPSEWVVGTMVFHSLIETLSKNNLILITSPEITKRIKNFKLILSQITNSVVFDLKDLKIKGDGPYKNIIRFCGFLRLISEIGRIANIDLDSRDFLTQVVFNYKRGQFYKVYHLRKETGFEKIVTIGGGNGNRQLLEKLKDLNPNITAILSMADSGGSTGRLRDEYGILPVGDLRRALLALSSPVFRIRDDLDYRFNKGSLAGHNFINLIMLTLAESKGNFLQSLDSLKRLFKIKGDILPVSLESYNLYAQLEDGQIVAGETNIDVPKHDPTLKIKKVWLYPKTKTYKKVTEEIRKADIIIIGPGDLYSSVIPSLLVGGIQAVLKESKAKKILIVNSMTKLGETNNFSVQNFTDETEKYMGAKLDYVIFNTKKPSVQRLKKYKKKHPELLDLTKINKNLNKKKFIGKNLLTKSGDVIYDPKKLIKIILSL